MRIYFKYLLGDISTKFARAFLEINTVNRTFRLPGGGGGTRRNEGKDSLCEES